jgi:hypothetical protein
MKRHSTCYPGPGIQPAPVYLSTPSNGYQYYYHRVHFHQYLAATFEERHRPPPSTFSLQRICTAPQLRKKCAKQMRGGGRGCCWGGGGCGSDFFDSLDPEATRLVLKLRVRARLAARCPTRLLLAYWLYWNCETGAGIRKKL